MEEGRKKLRIFLACIVGAAILMGIIYYFTDIYHATDISEGTLVMIMDEEM